MVLPVVTWPPGAPAEALLGDEADLAVWLEHGPPHALQRPDLLLAGFFGQILRRKPLAPQVALNRLAVLHHHQRVTLEHSSQGRNPVAEVRRRDLQNRDC